MSLMQNSGIIFTAWRLYNWTADTEYILGDDFTRFCNLSLNEYLDSWQLRSENVMNRPRYMNREDTITPDNRFFHCRGIPSYVENFPGICVGLDLLGALYAGHSAAASICKINLLQISSGTLLKEAALYRNLMEDLWWDEANSRYYTFFTEDGQFAYGEGIPFALWFGIIPEGTRRDASVNAILNRDWNIENLSYFPALLLDLGYPNESYELLSRLPHMERSEYPEVSFAIIEAIVRAATGLRPDASTHTLATEYRLGSIATDMEVRNIPLFDGTVDIIHNANISTTLSNHTSQPIIWEAIFNGNPERSVTVEPGKTTTVQPCN